MFAVCYKNTCQQSLEQISFHKTQGVLKSKHITQCKLWNNIFATQIYFQWSLFQVFPTVNKVFVETCIFGALYSWILCILCIPVTVNRCEQLHLWSWNLTIKIETFLWTFTCNPSVCSMTVKNPDIWAENTICTIYPWSTLSTYREVITWYRTLQLMHFYYS